MDKQSTPTKYVRITKAAQDERVWYSKKDFIGGIYEVTDYDRHRYELADDTVHGKAFARCILKSDCEPYEFPTLQTESDDDDLNTYAAMFAASVPESKSVFTASCEAFIAGYKAAPVQKGHTITTEQLKHLYTSISNADSRARYCQNTLRVWFPDVFKPERTYKTGDKIKVFAVSEPTVYIIVEPIDKHIVLIDPVNGRRWDDAKPVSDIRNISEAELKDYLGKVEYQLVE